MNMRTELTMKNNFLTPLVLLTALCAAISLMSCEFGVNPLLFDGPPVGANFTASTPGALYADSTAISLHQFLMGVENNVDSISVINISLQIDSLNNGTLASTTLSGIGSIDGTPLLTLNHVPLSEFASERSIFDPALASTGATSNPAGARYIDNVLKHPESMPASIMIKISGNASRSGLYFKAHLKLYTQVFLKK